MMSRVIGFEVKLVILVVVLVFFLKACGSPKDEAAIKVLGPEPENVSEVVCDGGMSVAASAQRALLMGEITQEDFWKVNVYSNEYEVKTAEALVKATMSESEAIYAVKLACNEALYKYKIYQRAKENLERSN